MKASAAQFDVQVVQLQAACAEQLLQSISLNTFFDYIIAADSCCDKELLDACLAFGACNRYSHMAHIHSLLVALQGFWVATVKVI